jgi:hypothetical protein
MLSFCFKLSVVEIHGLTRKPDVLKLALIYKLLGFFAESRGIMNDLWANKSARLHDLICCWVDIGTALDPVILAANLWFWRS